MSQVTRPTGLTLNKNEGKLVITWDDEKTCEYPLSHLREACPCVECRGGHRYMGKEHDPANILVLTPKRDYAIDTIQMIGNYAIQPIWEDGHSTGIYSWDYLRRLCP